MEFRKAVLSDIYTLANLRIDMLCEENPLSDEQKRLLHTNTIQFFEDGLVTDSVLSWVAISHDNIVGMGCINFFSFPPNDWCPNGKTAYIGNMYTLPDFRGQGIASNILAHLIGEAKLTQCQRILLFPTDMGRPLYEKSGFENAPTAMVFFPFGINPLS